MASPRSAAAPARRAVDWLPLGIYAGLAAASLVLLWLLVALLRSDGATWRLLLPWLLFLLPVLSIGAATGWLAGLALRAGLAGWRRR
ncbi:MAG TPA: hypothetical protein VKV26_08265 [Dehalococcoidia bacterium]|nr:hypothetical protein [Dehalococcoidia bacterium]